MLTYLLILFDTQSFLKILILKMHNLVTENCVAISHIFKYPFIFPEPMIEWFERLVLLKFNYKLLFKSLIANIAKKGVAGYVKHKNL